MRVTQAQHQQPDQAWVHWHTWSRLYWPSHTLSHPKDTGETGDRQSYSNHLVLVKEGRADKTTKEKKRKGKHYLCNLQGEDKSIYTAREFHNGNRKQC